MFHFCSKISQNMSGSGFEQGDGFYAGGYEDQNQNQDLGYVQQGYGQEQ